MQVRSRVRLRLRQLPSLQLRTRLRMEGRAPSGRREGAEMTERRRERWWGGVGRGEEWRQTLVEVAVVAHSRLSLLVWEV